MSLIISPSKLSATQVRSFPEIFKINSPSIVDVKKELGETVAQATLTFLINDLVDFFSVGKTMDGKSVADTVKLIMKKFYYLKIEDIKFCFEKMRFAEYGKTYDRIDGNIILETLNVYSNDRADVAESAQEDADKIEIPVIPGAAKIFSDVRVELEKERNKDLEFERFKKHREEKRKEFLTSLTNQCEGRKIWELNKLYAKHKNDPEAIQIITEAGNKQGFTGGKTNPEGNIKKEK